MAHFAWLDANNMVTAVSVVDNVNLLDANGNESEAVGVAYLTSVHGEGKVWKQTSYNANPIEGQDRGKYAGIGDVWDGSKFVAPTSEVAE
jgi:exosome complex RNA-binding protein Rrp42 (RNase PH superfamily)